MVIEVVVVVVVLGCCLVALLKHPGEKLPRPDLEASLDTVDDAGLFRGWDELTSSEQKRRLAIYQQRVRARIAEQEREWLRERLRVVAKG